MGARKRKENESFEDYRESLKQEDKALKASKKGTMWWPASRGTYVRPKEGKVLHSV